MSSCQEDAKQDIHEGETCGWKIGELPVVVPTKEVYCMEGEVVKGFQRGSKLLGWPTANLEPVAFKSVLVDLPRGVYCGWASIQPSNKVYKAVCSLGTNPHFNNKEDTVEAYLVHEFPEDFYGASMKLMICGYLRPQVPFKDMDSLIKAIDNDVKVSVTSLDKEFVSLSQHKFFESAPSITSKTVENNEQKQQTATTEAS